MYSGSLIKWLVLNMLSYKYVYNDGTNVIYAMVDPTSSYKRHEDDRTIYTHSHNLINEPHPPVDEICASTDYVF